MRNIFTGFGNYLILIRGIFARPEKAQMYWKEMFRQMHDIGIGSLSIIAIIATFIGAVTAVQFSYQLRSFSLVPMWWMGSIVRKSMILELAPTISALLLAGKVGSNIASELGSMRISEQIDAYEIMGVNTQGYLVGPKIMASLVVIPMLIILAVFLGISGGMMAGLLGKFFTPSEYIRGLQDNFAGYDVVVMLIKSFLFAFIISSISCFKGYTVSGGALEIGRASTQAVVISSIVIIVVNFITAFILL
ncbi:MAG: ABC transporter permease [Chitinophagales bacterium]|jgi:phospholipid/cholesterol/gamma-HCH transport system permease protein|nr:ABC transporter permease [Chitinophagales bacterium]